MGPELELGWAFALAEPGAAGVESRGLNGPLASAGAELGAGVDLGAARIRLYLCGGGTLGGVRAAQAGRPVASVTGPYPRATLTLESF